MAYGTGASAVIENTSTGTLTIGSTTATSCSVCYGGYSGNSSSSTATIANRGSGNLIIQGGTSYYGYAICALSNQNEKAYLENTSSGTLSIIGGSSESAHGISQLVKSFGSATITNAQNGTLIIKGNAEAGSYGIYNFSKTNLNNYGTMILGENAIYSITSSSSVHNYSTGRVSSVSSNLFKDSTSFVATKKAPVIITVGSTILQAQEETALTDIEYALNSNWKNSVWDDGGTLTFTDIAPDSYAAKAITSAFQAKYGTGTTLKFTGTNTGYSAGEIKTTLEESGQTAYSSINGTMTDENTVSLKNLLASGVAWRLDEGNLTIGAAGITAVGYECYDVCLSPDLVVLDTSVIDTSVIPEETSSTSTSTSTHVPVTQTSSTASSSSEDISSDDEIPVVVDETSDNTPTVTSASGYTLENAGSGTLSLIGDENNTTASGDYAYRNQRYAVSILSSYGGNYAGTILNSGAGVLYIGSYGINYVEDGSVINGSSTQSESVMKILGDKDKGYAIYSVSSSGSIENYGLLQMNAYAISNKLYGSFINHSTGRVETESAQFFETTQSTSTQNVGVTFTTTGWCAACDMYEATYSGKATATVNDYSWLSKWSSGMTWEDGGTLTFNDIAPGSHAAQSITSAFQSLYGTGTTLKFTGTTTGLVSTPSSIDWSDITAIGGTVKDSNTVEFIGTNKSLYEHVILTSGNLKIAGNTSVGLNLTDPWAIGSSYLSNAGAGLLEVIGGSAQSVVGVSSSSSASVTNVYNLSIGTTTLQGGSASGAYALSNNASYISNTAGTMNILAGSGAEAIYAVGSINNGSATDHSAILNILGNTENKIYAIKATSFLDDTDSKHTLAIYNYGTLNLNAYSFPVTADTNATISNYSGSTLTIESSAIFNSSIGGTVGEASLGFPTLSSSSEASTIVSKEIIYTLKPEWASILNFSEGATLTFTDIAYTDALTSALQDAFGTSLTIKFAGTDTLQTTVQVTESGGSSGSGSSGGSGESGETGETGGSDSTGSTGADTTLSTVTVDQINSVLATTDMTDTVADINFAPTTESGTLVIGSTEEGAITDSIGFRSIDGSEVDVQEGKTLTLIGNGETVASDKITVTDGTLKLGLSNENVTSQGGSLQDVSVETGSLVTVATDGEFTAKNISMEKEGASMENGATLTADSVTLAEGSSLANTGTLTTATLSGSGEVSNQGTLNITEALSTASSLVNEGSISAPTISLTENGASLQNAKDSEVTATIVSLVSGSTLSNQGTLTTETLSGSGEVSNQGRLTVTEALSSASSIVNQGSLSAPSIELTQSGASLQNAAGSEVSATTVTLAAGSTFANEGTLKATTLTGDGLASNKGDLSVTSILSSIENSGTVTTDAVKLSTEGSSVSNSDSFTAKTVELASGTSLSNSGEFSATTLSGAGTATNLGSFNVTNIATSLDNQGTVTTETVSLETKGGALSNASNAEFTATSVSIASGTTLSNLGTFSATTLSGAGSATNDGIFNVTNIASSLANNGTVTAETVSLETAGSALSNTKDFSATNVSIASGTTLQNSGTFTATSLTGAGAASNEGTFKVTNIASSLENKGVVTTETVNLTTAGSTVSNAKEFTAQTVKLADNTSVSNSGTFSADSLSGSGSVQNSGNFNVSTIASFTSLVNNGTVSTHTVTMDKTGSTLTNNQTFTADTVALASGSSLQNTGSFTAATLSGSGTVQNQGGLTVTTLATSMTNSGNVSAQTVKAETAGTVIDNQAVMKADSMTVAEGAKLTNSGTMSASSLTGKGTIQNSGLLVVASSIDPIQNKGTVIADSIETTETVVLSGTMVLDKLVTYGTTKRAPNANLVLGGTAKNDYFLDNLSEARTYVEAGGKVSQAVLNALAEEDAANAASASAIALMSEDEGDTVAETETETTTVASSSSARAKARAATASASLASDEADESESQIQVQSDTAEPAATSEPAATAETTETTAAKTEAATETATEAATETQNATDETGAETKTDETEAKATEASDTSETKAAETTETTEVSAEGETEAEAEAAILEALQQALANAQVKKNGEVLSTEASLTSDVFGRVTRKTAQMENKALFGTTGVWMTPEAEKSEFGSYKSDRYGVSAGGLFAFNEGDTTAGASAYYSRGKLKGYVRKNVEGYGLSVFGAQRFGAGFVAGTASVSKDTTTKSDKVGATAIVASVKTGLSLSNKHVMLSPYVGVRGVAIKTDNAKNAKTVQTPVGARLVGKARIGGWTVLPEADIAYARQFKDRSLKLNTGDTSVFAGKYAVQGQVGLSVRKNKVTASLNYSGATGDKGYRNHSLSVSLNYRF